MNDKVLNAIPDSMRKTRVSISVTGGNGSEKLTISRAIQYVLKNAGIEVYLLDESPNYPELYEEVRKLVDRTSVSIAVQSDMPLGRKTASYQYAFAAPRDAEQEARALDARLAAYSESMTHYDEVPDHAPAPAVYGIGTGVPLESSYTASSGNTPVVINANGGDYVLRETLS